MIFRSKNTELIAALSAEVETLRAELQTERSKRIAAETIASERKQQLEIADERALHFENLYADATKERMKSLDVVNTALLHGIAPEQPQMREPGPQKQGQQTDISPKRPTSQIRNAQGAHIRAAIEKLNAKPKTETVQ